MAMTENTCPQCRKPLPPNNPEALCPECLIGLGLDRRYAPTSENTSGRPGFEPPTPEELVEHFPQLEIERLVGCGGMGAVYKARQKGLGRQVALKILPPAAAADPAFAERFSREARALAMLNHPSIVTVHDSGRAGEYYYLIMEFVDGVNLRDALRAGELTPGEALPVVMQICDALQYAHDQGVVHRDIKPENVMLDMHGQVKVTDFGLAKLVREATDEMRLTATCQVMGTPRYMAPEQMEGSASIDHRADLYSLGVVFYELLTGELPLGRFAPPSRRAKVDARLDEVVMRTLEKEPARRYQKASDIKTAVQGISAGRTPYRARGVTGYEYRSARTVFGVPLVHIATGIDPDTGRKRVARGIIAMGDIAVGVLAMGGVAYGGIVFGGMAVGLFAIGGLSIGLMLALGGCALGMGLSAGGFALGSIAFGGAAVGVYAYGGGAFGLHAYGGNVRSAEALRFLNELRDLLSLRALASIRFTPAWTILPAAALAAALSLLLVVLLFRAGSAWTARSAKPAKPAEPPRRQHSNVGCVAALCLLAALTILPVIAVVTYWMSYRAPRPATMVAETQIATGPPLASATNSLEWRMGVDGPEITGRLSQDLGLTLPQERRVNQLLREARDESIELVKRHVQHDKRSSDRHLFVIEPFPDEIDAVERDFWNRLQSELDDQQYSIVRGRLRLRAEVDESPVSPRVFFPWGRQACRVDVQKDDTWHFWTILRGDVSEDGRAVDLPEPLRRLWEIGQQER